MKYLKFLAFLILVLSLNSVYAQRGAGEPYGIGQRLVKPDVTTINATIEEIMLESCPGDSRSTIGTHMLVKNEDGTKLDLHAGPGCFVNEMISALKPGEIIQVEVFRTENMPEDQFVIKSVVTSDNQRIDLRDEQLIPFWAGWRFMLR